ncbi:CobW family GTP-binding protein [Paludibacterium yongneupense]|uniref:CobW family GTP-binding protein n=1 Tax=Paludibacterium yongneupense TaxID=400061 RepID=UPI0003FF96A4|nr:GTP-binding protein [Paludibacterium yongneupense]
MSGARLPVTIVTGFLGAGKTTLLARLIADSPRRRLALLVNEFGEVSIDGALLREHGADGRVEIHDLAHGLIAYGDDEAFEPTLQALWERRALIDHVLIETSGLALPTAVMERLQGEALASRFILDATLSVVDTPLLLAGSFDANDSSAAGAIASLFRQQLANADIVILNKIDALDDEALLRAEARVRALAPAVRFIEPAHTARLDPRLTLGLHLHEASAGGPRHFAPASLRPLADQGAFDGHSHGGMNAHSHGLATHKHFHEHDPGWQSFVVKSADAQDLDTLRRAVASLAQEQAILRVKGFARGEAGRIVIQAVRGRVDARLDAALPPRLAQLIVIGYHPNRPRLVAELSRLTATRWR